MKVSAEKESQCFGKHEDSEIFKKHSEKMQKEDEKFEILNKEVLGGQAKKLLQSRMLVSPKEIRKTCLKHCLDVLKKNETNELFKDQMKLKEVLVMK